MARSVARGRGSSRARLGPFRATAAVATAALCWARLGSALDLAAFLLVPSGGSTAARPLAAFPRSLHSTCGYSWVAGAVVADAGRPVVTRRAWDLFGAVGELLGQSSSGDGNQAQTLEIPDAPLPGGPDAPEGFDRENMQLDILQYPHPALRRDNQPIEEFDGRLRKLADNLFRSLYTRGDGIGLAAPQVGVNLRVMVYNPDPSSRDGETVFVNPRIIEISGESDVESESCLSFPRMRGPVKRPVWVRVQAMDWDGCPFERQLNGFEARLFQHEYDHLDGVVYIDRLADSWRCGVQPDLNFLIEDYRRSGRDDEAL